MNITHERRAYLELHLAVFLFGFTAILGDLIQLSALVLVWWRVLITSGVFAPLVGWRRLRAEVPAAMLWRYAGIGVLVALHWLTFYGAIKLANASIALVCLATTSFLTALLEPLIVGRQFRWYELALGFLIVPGMALVVNSVQVDMLAGVWVGLVSALLVTVFSALNKRYISHSNPIRITFLELSSAWVFLSVVMLARLALGYEAATFWPPHLSDWLYLVVLALLCTNLAYVLSLRALHHLSAFASNLTINLEPVYGIALAWLLLADHQELSPGFYWGVLVILAAVFAYPVLKRRMDGGAVISKS